MQLALGDEEPLSETSTLMKHLLAASAQARSSADGGRLARLLEAAAHALQQQMAEAKVQRGLAIASQTLAAELSLKCDELQRQMSQQPQPPQPRAELRRSEPAPPPHSPPPRAVASRHNGLHARAEGLEVSTHLNKAETHAVPSTMAPEDTHRLGPRAFKTWVQEPPQPWQGATQPSAGDATQRNAEAEAQAERQVEAMVENLKARFKQSGVALPLEKHHGCVYRLGARKLSLNIRNHRLMVRVGGGFCDFLEYLGKASL